MEYAETERALLIAGALGLLAGVLTEDTADPTLWALHALESAGALLTGFYLGRWRRAAVEGDDKPPPG